MQPSTLVPSSDHCAVIAILKAKRSNPHTKVKLVRGTNKITTDQWCKEFQLSNVLLTNNLAESMSSINMEPQCVLNTLTLEQEKRVSLKAKQPWYDKEMAGLKCKV